jgi:hypothetical protein
MTSAVNELRGNVAAAIQLLEHCRYSRGADWFREMDRILVAPDVDGSHLAAAKLLAASAAGMGRPLEVLDPMPESGLSREEANRRRDMLIDSMWHISKRMAEQADL